MKKTERISALLLAAVLALSLAGCGASSYSAEATTDSAYTEEASGSGVSYTVRAANDSGFGLAADYDSPAAAEPESESASGDIADMTEKIIYTGDAELETTEFDDALEQVESLVKELGGFMESTSVSGNNYYSISRGSTGGRYANFTIRVPSDKFQQLMSSLPTLGNVPYSYTSMENITMEYYDTQSRLEAYQTQETRLLEMLAAAETVDDMLAIQQQLTEVQYEIDSLSSKLRYYDHQVNYSTVTLTVEEVSEYTPEPTVTLTYWERMGRGFRDSLKAVGTFCKNFFLWFVTSLPWLVPVGAVIVIAWILIRRRLEKNAPERAERRKARRAAKKAEREAKKAAKAARKSGAVTPSLEEPPKSEEPGSEDPNSEAPADAENK